MKKLLFLFAILLAGCQQGGGPITQADKDAIQKNIDGFAEAINTNPANVANGYADDVVSLPPHAGENAGKQKTVEFHTAPGGPKVVSFTLATQEIEGNGGLAYSRGTWTYKGMLNDTLEINDNGKFLLVLKKQADNSWKVSHETWNSNLPIPGQ